MTREYQDFSKYQKKANSTAVYPKLKPSCLYPLLGIAGESGEICEKVKKVVRDKGGRISKSAKEEMVKEIGDVLWYLAMFSYELGVDFAEVARRNVDKLEDRKRRNKIHGAGDNR